jgi:hypothetical protein
VSATEVAFAQSSVSRLAGGIPYYALAGISPFIRRARNSQKDKLGTIQRHRFGRDSVNIINSNIVRAVQLISFPLLPRWSAAVSTFSSLRVRTCTPPKSTLQQAGATPAMPEGRREALGGHGLLETWFAPVGVGAGMERSIANR